MNTLQFVFSSSFFSEKMCEIAQRVFVIFVVASSIYILDSFFGVSFGFAGGILIPLFHLGACGCGASGGGSGSTPFLCTWNGEQFVFENDFLLGSPSTFYKSKEEGLKAYNNGKTGPDLYRIKNSFVPKDGKITFQIKEVEPEESFIDFLSLTRVVYPKTGELVVNSNHTTFHVFEKDALSCREGIVEQEIFVRGKKITGAVGETRRVFEERGKTKQEGEYRLEVGDTIEIRGTVRDKNTPLFLLLGSRFRDWTAGEIPSILKKDARGKIISPFFNDFFTASPKDMIKMVGFIVLASVVSFSGIIGATAGKLGFGTHRAGVQEDNRLLAETFVVPRAHADAPAAGGGGIDGEGAGGDGDGGACSLLVESYWDWEKGDFQLAEVIHPRHNQYSVDAVSLPQKAISKTGKVRVRITATKRHYVGLASLFAPSKTLNAKAETLSMETSFHSRLKKDVTTTVTNKHSGDYLHTVPGDVVDVSFAQAKSKIKKNEQEAYLLCATGFYTPLSTEGARMAGNWVEKLDSDSRALLKDMYPLKDYHNPDRTTVLS